MPKRRKLKKKSYSIEAGSLSRKQIAAFQREENKRVAKRLRWQRKILEEQKDIGIERSNSEEPFSQFDEDEPESLNDHCLSYQSERSSWTENINRNPATTAELEFDPDDLDSCLVCGCTHFSEENPIIFCERDELCRRKFKCHQDCFEVPPNIDEQYFCPTCFNELVCYSYSKNFFEPGQLISCKICRRVGHKQCFNVTSLSIVTTEWVCRGCHCKVCGRRGNDIEMCEICLELYHPACSQTLLCPNGCSIEESYPDDCMNSTEERTNYEDGDDNIIFGESSNDSNENDGRIRCQALGDITNLIVNYKLNPDRAHIYNALKWHLTASSLDSSKIWSDHVKLFRLKGFLTENQAQEASKVRIPQNLDRVLRRITNPNIQTETLKIEIGQYRVEADFCFRNLTQVVLELFSSKQNVLCGPVYSLNFRDYEARRQFGDRFKNFVSSLKKKIRLLILNRILSCFFNFTQTRLSQLLAKSTH